MSARLIRRFSSVAQPGPRSAGRDNKCALRPPYLCVFCRAVRPERRPASPRPHAAYTPSVLNERQTPGVHAFSRASRTPRRRSDARYMRRPWRDSTRTHRTAPLKAHSRSTRAAAISACPPFQQGERATAPGQMASAVWMRCVRARAARAPSSPSRSCCAGTCYCTLGGRGLRGATLCSQCDGRMARGPRPAGSAPTGVQPCRGHAVA